MLTLALTLAAVASPLSAYTGAQGQGMASVTPGSSFDGSGTMSPNTYFGSGLGDRADLNLGTGLSIGPDGVTAPYLDILPRLFVDDHLAFVPHVAYDLGSKDVAAGLEVHHVLGDGSLTLATNLGWMTSVGASGTGPGAAYAIFAPEIYLTDAFSVFVEVAPSYDLAAGAFGTDLTPGISACFDADCNHSAAAGVSLTVAGGPIAPVVGAWYSVSFETRRPELVVAAAEE